MHQQLIEQTILITPDTMREVIPKLTHTIAQNNLTESMLEPIVKSIFYGLWNFDKMINQHNLSTEISEIITKVPKKNAFAFLGSLLKHIMEKWNFIDHHRINKFMQLTKYLLKQGLKVSQKKTDQLLLETVFSELSQRSGIADHFIEVYYNTACEIFCKPDYKGKDVIGFQKLEVFEKLLQNGDASDYIREHVMQKIYEKYKSDLLELANNQKSGSAEQILKKIDQFNAHIFEIAKSEQNDNNRKGLYTLIGFMKSDHSLFSIYLKEKEEKRQMELEKKTKKISKFKKELIKEEKKKRKEMKRANKKQKIISKSKFQFKARENLQKMMQ